MNSYVKAFSISMLSGFAGAIPLICVFMFYTLPSFEAETHKHKQKSAEVAVDNALSILSSYEQKVTSKELTLEEAQTQAAAMISKLRYNKDEYLWINDLEPKMIMHPFKPELNGKNIADIKDPSGKHIFIKMVETVGKSGEGYVHYVWDKPGSKEPVAKVSFVKLFSAWHWVVGSGVYVDDVEEAVAANRKTNLLYFSLALSVLVAVTAANAFQQIRRWVIPVQKAMSDLSSSSDTLLGSAEEFRTSSDLMAKSGTHQQAAIHQISSAVEEITAMIQSAGEIARKSSDLSQKTALSAHQGEESVQRVLSAIEKITTTAGNTVNLLNAMKQNIRSMNAILSEISSKTNFINDVVFQTKLLSYNAAVEAARAGEHGKGFSVVAHEIGKLAELSGSSSREITAILEKSQTLIEQIISKSDEQSLLVGFQNDEALAIGDASVKECSSLLAALGVQAKQAYSMSLGILEAHKAQTLGADEILKGVHYLDSNTEEHLALSDRNRELSDHVSDTADDLSSIVDRLKAAAKIKEDA